MWSDIFIGNVCVLGVIFFVMGIGHLTYADYYTELQEDLVIQIFIGIPMVIGSATMFFFILLGISSPVPQENAPSLWEVYGAFIFVISCIFYIVVGSQVIIHFYKKTRLYFGVKRNKVKP